MLRLVFIFALLTFPALAQDAQKRIEATIGALVVENATLVTQRDDMAKRLAEVEKELAALKAKEEKK